jgi:hypothetical protein
VLPEHSLHLGFGEVAGELVEAVFEPRVVDDAAVLEVEVTEGALAGVALVVFYVGFVPDFLVHCELDLADAGAGDDFLVDSEAMDYYVDEVL